MLFIRYNYDDQISENEMGGACGLHEEMKNIHKILAGKLEGKRPIRGVRLILKWI